MPEKRKLMVLPSLDIDSCSGAWVFLKVRELSKEDVDWLFIRSGSRASAEQIGDREAIHLDTGLIFDGVANFDHHQDDPRVKYECATSLVYKSFRRLFGDDPILELMVEFVRKVDLGRGSEGVEIIRGPHSFLMRGLSSLLSSLRPKFSNTDIIRAGFYNLEAFYEGSRRSLALAEEIRTNPRIKFIPTSFGTVFFGETGCGHKELRSFINHNLSGKINLIIASYKDHSVGITHLGKREDWKVNLQKVYDLIVKKFPESGSRAFLHQHKFLIYINPTDGGRKSVPGIGDLFELVREAYFAGTQ